MQRPLLAVLLIATALWSAYAFLFAMDVVAMGQKQDIHVSWQEAAAFSFGGWLTWIPFTVGLYAAVCRFPIQRGQIIKAIVVLTGAVLVVVLLKAIYVYFTQPIFTWYLEPPQFGTVMADSMKNNFMTGWAVVGVSHSLLFYHRAREKERTVAELEAGLASAKLEAIRARLNPHFMFNALNSVSEMVHQDADAAENMLVALSRLLRDSLSGKQEAERPLADEIALAKDYLMIEKFRLGERLRVEWVVDDAALRAQAPALILQPLIENAVIHSISRRKEPGWLRVTAKAVGQRLLIGVDNSHTPGDASTPGSGLGLESIVSRLAIIHGANASFKIDTSDPAVYSARLDLPLTVSRKDAA
ncbi:MAG: hypothetical protein EON93_03910 [Burkholderiales bacterium]|nr:MAG: hypothetical protein EON93_03910 [Burkholderiales bacterium]